jgi:hypothetical protein
LFFSEIHRLQADHATPAMSHSKSVGSTNTGFIKHFHISWRHFDTFKICLKYFGKYFDHVIFEIVRDSKHCVLECTQLYTMAACVQLLCTITQCRCTVYTRHGVSSSSSMHAYSYTPVYACRFIQYARSSSRSSSFKAACLHSGTIGS